MPDAGGEVMRILAQAPPAYLGRAILTGAGRTGLSALDRPRARRDSGLKLLLVRNLFLKLPKATFSRAELVVFAVLLLPGLIAALPVLLVLGVPFSIASLLFIPAVRIYDPYRLSGVSPAGPVEQWRRRLVEHVKGLARRGEGAWGLDLRRVKDTLLAQAVLRHEPIDPAVASAGTVRRVTRRLLRAGLLGSPALVAVEVMGNQNLLGAVADLAPRRPHGPARPPDPLSDGGQLAAALPIRGAWRGFALVALLSVFITSTWVAQLALLCGPDLRAWLCLDGLREALLLCLYFASLQHALPLLRRLVLRRSNREAAPSTGDPWPGFRFLGGSLTVLLLFWLHCNPVRSGPSPPWHAGVECRFDGARFLVCLGPLLFTNHLVPEWLARWRGAGLLYPSGTALWSQRILCTLILIGASTLLAWAIAPLM
jgi:hypothetical protein